MKAKYWIEIQILFGNINALQERQSRVEAKHEKHS